MKHYTGNEVVILDDDEVEFTPTSRHVVQLQEYLINTIGKHITVEVATTPRQWLEVHEATGAPLLVLHDWDIGGLYGIKQYFPHTVSSSIKSFLDKGFSVALYTSGTLEYARRAFFSFEQLQYIEKGNWKKIAVILDRKKEYF